MEFLLLEIDNDIKTNVIARLPHPGHVLTSFRFIGNNRNEFLNDYAIMCFRDENILGVFDLNDLTTINITKFPRKIKSCFKVIDELKHVCLLYCSNRQFLYLINANESFNGYLKSMIEINGRFTNGKIMKTFYEIESNVWTCRICAIAPYGAISIYDTFSNLNDPDKYSVLKISQFNAHHGDITFTFIKGMLYFRNISHHMKIDFFNYDFSSVLIKIKK